MTKTNKLLLTSALASGMALAVPAHAQDAAQPVGDAAITGQAPADMATAELAETRLVALGGIIRPFAGDMKPYAGNIRSFAGPLSGSAGNIRSFAGNIRSFSGDAAASAGNIRSFAGNIRSFAGNIRSFTATTLPLGGPDKTFWGNLYPASGNLTASAGNIRSFSGAFGAYAGNIRSFAGNIRSFDGTPLPWETGSFAYTNLDMSINNLVSNSKATWGAAVTARTGKSFEDAFVNPMLARYGISLTDPKSLVGLDELTTEVFLLDWYDGLMNYSGVDQVDHWMKAVNWTPRITQDLGAGSGSKVGLLDFTVTGEGTSSIVKASGVSTVSGMHGSAVLSLITAAHDGRGVMGIAPGASVVSYNPFDTTYTAGWTDIRNGVLNLVKNGATIVNMSLGVPGWTLNAGWNDVFTEKAISDEARKRVFVLAAGNDGVVQTQNVTWAFDKNPAIIVVGSVDPNGTISDFSNRPGTACLTKDGKMAGDGSCTGNANDRQLLMNRFIVAPGEWMLVSDGAGGVTRMSGTSFAAPLVSGTVALIHDRWPWLASRPADTAEIVLSSARDLGAPGTDPVYGRGMLDVAAALSPKALSALTYKVTVAGKVSDVKVNELSSTQRTAMLNTWEANGAYISAFDDTLTSYRDFQIAMSSKLVGQTVGTTGEQFNSYLTQRFTDWFKGTGAGFASGGHQAFGAARYAALISTGGGMEAIATASPRAYRPGLRQSGVGFETGIALRDVNSGLGVRFGTGRGGAALGQAGFGMQSDYDVQTGGANPFLGLASGSGYAAMDVRLSPKLIVTSGIARQDAVRDTRQLGIADQFALGGIDPYRASAATLSIRYQATPWATATLGYTLLDESTGLLGMQSLDRNDLAHGTKSDATTFGLDLSVARGLSLSGSATVGRTRGGGPARQAIAVANGGLISSAFQAAVTKVGLFGDDRLRLSLAQPLHLERGSIEVANVQVVDRQTGELGTVVQRFDLSGGERRHVAELLYGRTIMGGIADLNLFGRADLNGAGTQGTQGQSAVTVGSSFRLGF